MLGHDRTIVSIQPVVYLDQFSRQTIRTIIVIPHSLVRLFDISGERFEISKWVLFICFLN